MKKIIVPVDFSNFAHNAYLYARRLAKDLNASLEVIHIYKEERNTQNTLSENENKASQLENHLLDFIRLYPEEKGHVMTKLKVATKIITGDIKTEIIAVSKEADTSMIVMATTGDSEMSKKILGGISIYVAQQADCPVILVPSAVIYEPLKSILYACNFESVEEDKIQEVVGFGNLFRATLHFLHVTERREKNYADLENKLFNQLFKEGDPAFSFNMVTVKSDSIVKGLNQYIRENNIDLAVLVNRQRNVLDNLLKHSLTKEMTLHTTVPLMIYH